MKRDTRYLSRKWALTVLRSPEGTLAKQELLSYADAARLGEITADRVACSMLEGVPLGKDNDELIRWAGWLPQELRDDWKTQAAW